MSVTNRSLFRSLLPGVFLGFVVLLGLAFLGDLQHVSSTILEFKVQYFGIALAFTLLNYALRFVKWHIYLKQIGVHRLKIGTSLRIFVAGFPLAVTPGKVGEVLKGVWLMRKTSVPVGRGVSVVLAERLSDGLAVALLSTIGILAFPQYWLGFAILLAGLIGVMILSQIRPAALWVLDQIERVGFLRRFSQNIREFYEGSFTLFQPGVAILAVGLGLISWLGEGIGFYFILRGLGLEPTSHLLHTAVFILAFSTIIGAVSALPGGLGAAEISIAGLLTLTLHLSPDIASTATVLIRLATLWFGVFLGVITWSFSPDLTGLDMAKRLIIEPNTQPEKLLK